MEYIDVVDENNELTGEVCERKELREKNLWYRAVSIIVINEKYELLLQRRAKNKKTLPNMWAITAGHVDSGESEAIAAMRETQEEIGMKNLSLEDLEFLGVKKHTEFLLRSTIPI